MMSIKLPHKLISCLLLMLVFSSCKKEDIDDGFDKYSFTKVHYKWSVNGMGQVTSSSSSSSVTISLPTIEKTSIINFEGIELSYYKHGQPDTTKWIFTPNGDYNYSPYNGASLYYFPLNDSIHFSHWYGGSHTMSNSDNYYGKKIN